MKAARDALKLEKRKPTEADAPPLSKFPMTPGAKAALRLGRELRRS